MTVNPIGSEADEGEASDASDSWTYEDEQEKLWKLVSGKFLIKKEQRELRAHFFKDVTAYDRFLDKITFVLSVTGCVFMTYCASSPFGRRFIPYFFPLTTLLLFVIRYLQYKRRKWHYFLLDFCYAANIAVIFYLMVPGAAQSSLFFVLLFSITHSILPWTILAYRNSIVFHSIDKITSVAIHLFPTVVIFVLRAFPEDCAAAWYTDFAVDAEDDIADFFGIEPSWYAVALFMYFGTLICFGTQQLWEIFLIHYVAKQPCCSRVMSVASDPEVLTLFRYALIKEKGSTYRMLTYFGKEHMVKMWFILNIYYTMQTALLPYLFYRFRSANIVFVSFVFVAGLWHGATFYLEVLTRGYVGRRHQKKKQKKKKEEAGDAA